MLLGEVIPQSAKKMGIGQLSYAFPFSSLPKYVVHLSLRASLLKLSVLFLHFPEQNQRIVPSFLTYIIPVPDGNSLPQKEHFLDLGIGLSPYAGFQLSREFLCFSLCFSEHQYVLDSNWTFDIS